MDISNTTARLRRTFHYPTDDSSNGGTPEVLDEEEQETLIQTLAEQNAATNQQYTHLLLALPALAAIPYILALFRTSTFLIALLGLSSLASTAFLLASLPPTETGLPLLDKWARSPSSSSPVPQGQDDEDGASRSVSGLEALNQVRQRRRRRLSGTLSPGAATLRSSPLERYLPYLNVGLCAILIMSGLLGRQVENEEGAGREGSGNFGLLGLGNLPAIVYAVVVVAKVVMASVDPEAELAALKYGLKGA